MSPPDISAAVVDERLATMRAFSSTDERGARHTWCMTTRPITRDDRIKAVRRVSKTIESVHLTETQIAAIEKATRQDSGTRYSAVIR